jgi:dTDP-4-dehydrorhamnose 3,5-epimerase
MKIYSTEIDGLNVVDADPLSDHRGTFARLFCNQELADILGKRKIVQTNFSRTNKTGAVRGLHFQYPPHAEMKLIRCIKGKVWDVAVDLRAGSDSFLQYHSEELSAENMKMIVIPEGFAHGFQVLEPDSELLYLHTALYEKNVEGAILYNDPKLNITWPLPVADISARDNNHQQLNQSFLGIKL